MSSSRFQISESISKSPLSKFQTLKRWSVRRLQDQVYKNFQDQIYENSDLFFSKQRDKCPWTYCSYIFHYLLYRTRNCMIGMSILHTYVRVWLELDLSFLANFRSIWVVVIRLELPSLAWPGLGLGSCYVTPFMLMAPCQCYGYFDPISVENRTWGDGNGTCSVWCR
jgi:hypothetical protein